MKNTNFLSPFKKTSQIPFQSLKLQNGGRVAVIGGGPAGTFFSYFLLDMAERIGIRIQVDIYEPRDFTVPGPASCNMCAGVLHESLVQNLAAEGINLPDTVVQRAIDSNTLHMDVGSVCIHTPRHEKRIAATFRGSGPRGLEKVEFGSLDDHLMTKAVHKGAQHIHARVETIEWIKDPGDSDPKSRHLLIKATNGISQTYDLLAVTTGVNSALLKQFEGLDFGYKQPRTTRCFVREYYLGKELVTKYLGASMHAFLLDIPGLDFAALVPKGDYVTLSLLGDDIDKDMLQALVTNPAVKQCLPPDFPMDQFICWCSPRINVSGSKQPFGDRIVFIGDSGVTRLYKDGIGAAYRSAKAAATTAIFEGIAATDFRKRYLPFCRLMEFDNLAGRLIFTIVHLIKKMRFTRQAVLRMVADEQHGGASAEMGMSMVMWDMFTGSAPYREIFHRTLHPVFLMRFLSNIMKSLVSSGKVNQEMESKHAVPAARSEKLIPNVNYGNMYAEEADKTGALGKYYQDGQVIIQQGELGDCMYVIQEGKVEVVVNQDGKETRLAVREAGQFFGEMALFEQEVRMASVRSYGVSRILTVDKKNFLRRIHEDPSLAFHILKNMSTRIRQESQDVSRLEDRSTNLGVSSSNIRNNL